MTQTRIYDPGLNDVGQIVQEEIALLPDRYRAVVVLCDLESQTYEEAAQLLGRPLGTIKSRLARGRELLRGRMLRRGVGPATVGTGWILSAQSAQSAVPTISIAATSRLAAQIVTGCSRADTIPSEVLYLMEGALKIMFLSKLKVAATVVLIGCGVLAVSTIRGESGWSEAGQATGRDEPPKKDAAESKTRTPAPATSLVTSRLWPVDSDSSPSKPWETVVRIRIAHEHSTGFSSGTIIHSTADESLILSAARHFKRGKTANAREVPYRINVDLFDGKLGGANPNQVHFVETVSGELVDCDFEREVSLVRIRPNRQLPASKVVPRRWEPHVRMEMLTIGCSEGRDATAWNTVITNPRFRGLAGNADYVAIECQTAPKQGRTGGGLFTTDGYLAGVCNFAESKDNHGLYATPESIYRLLDRNNLTFVYATPIVAENEIDELIQAAERQIKKNDKDGVDHTIEQLNALIEARRQGLQDALRTLDGIYSRRRDELLYRASGSRRENRLDAVPTDDTTEPGFQIPQGPTIEPGADSRLDRILEEWRRRSAAWTCLDVRFTGRARNSTWAEDEPLTGRVVLTSSGRAYVDAGSYQPVPEEVWLIPNLPSWKVRRVDGVTSWISRGLVKSQLVP